MDRIQVVEVIYEFLRTQYPPPQSLLVAKLGVYLRRQFRYAPWIGSGFANLKEVLEDLEKRGLVHCRTNEKGALVVDLPSSPQYTPPVQVPALRSEAPQRLRSEIWNAFISETPPGLRFMHTKSGAVLVGQSSAPGSLTEWTQILPIPRNLQQQWAADFLRERGLASDQALTIAISSDRWYLDFPAHLKQREPGLSSAWNWTRTRKALEAVTKWCEENRIPIDIVLAAPCPKPPLRASDGPLQRAEAALSLMPISAVGTEVPTVGGAGLREKLLQVIGSMDIAELLELRVPLKHVAHFLSGIDAGASTNPNGSK